MALIGGLCGGGGGAAIVVLVVIVFKRRGTFIKGMLFSLFNRHVFLAHLSQSDMVSFFDCFSSRVHPSSENFYF
jgi:uncharacterized membrane protein (GlpM family)